MVNKAPALTAAVSVVSSVDPSAQLWGAAEALSGQSGLDLWPPDQLADAESLARAGPG
jgi:hypothetical protein